MFTKVAGRVRPELALCVLFITKLIFVVLPCNRL